MGGGGGGGQPTQSTVTNTNIPEYAKPYVENMLGATQQQLFNVSGEGQITGIKPYTPYSTDPTAYVAGFSPLQQQAFQGTAGLQVPAEYQAAAGMTGAAGSGSMGLGTQAAGAGQRYAQMATTPGDVQAYMSPYVQQALAPQLAEMQRQSDIVQQGLKGQAVQAGAFGGTRQALQASEQERNKQALMGQAIGQGYQGAYDRAIQSMQYGAGLGLQGLQTGLQGYGQGLQAAGQLAGIGGQGLQSQMGILGAQQQAGGQQQQQQQNIINQAIQNYATAQQYPQQQLAFMNAMLRGLPLQTATTQTYQAAPNPYSQLAGLGTAAYGAYKMFGKKGGLTQDFEKKYAGGGITDINRKVLLEPQKYSPQMLDRSMADGVVNPVIGGLAKAENADLVQRMQNAQMAQATQETPAGIDQANINPEMFTAAGGGIVAFANEGLVPQVVSPDDIAREEQEMVAGTRLEYSPAVKAALTAPSRQKETAYKTREQESMVGRGREIGKEFAGLVPSRAGLTTAATPAGIAAPGEYADEGSRGTAKGIIAGGPGKSPRDFGIGLTTPPTSVAAGPKAPAEPTAPAAPAKTDALSGYSEYQKLLESAGVSKDPYAADRAAVKEMKEKVAKDKQDAAAMALMQAGFGMMSGKSQYAMQNIGEGAKEGLAGYGKSMQEIKADEKEYAKINRELTKAEDALKRGDIEKYLDHKDKAETRAIQLRSAMAQEKAATKPSSTAEILAALKSKDPETRAAAQQFLGVNKTGTLTLEDALKALKELPSSAKLTPEQLIQQAQQMVALSRGGGGSTVPADIQTLLNKYR